MSAPPRKSSPASARWLRWNRRRTLWLGGALAVLLLLRVLLPVVLASAATYALERVLGLRAELEDVDLELVRGGVALEGAHVGRRTDPEGTEIDRDAPLVRWGRIYARLDWLDLLGGALHFREIVLDAPEIRLRRRDGRIDPLGRADRPAEPEAARDGEPGEPWPVRIGRLTLRDALFRIGGPLGEKELFAFSVEELGLADVSVEGANFSLGGVSLRGPSLRVRRDFALSLTGAEPASSPEPPSVSPPPVPTEVPPSAEATAPADAESAPEAEETVFALDRIEIERADFALVVGGSPLEASLSLTASGLSTEAGALASISVDLGIEGGSVHIEGELGLRPVAFDGRITWENIPVPPLSVAASPELATWVRSCHAGGDLTVRAHLGGDTPGIRLAGPMRIDAFSIADPRAEEIAVGFSSLSMDAREILLPLGDGSARPIRFAFERIALAEPAVRWTRPATALEAVLGAPAETPEEPGEEIAEETPDEVPPEAPSEPARGRPVEVTVEALEVSAGTVEFADRVVAPEYRTKLEQLALSARGVRWPALAARELTLSGSVPLRGTFEMSGDLAPEGGQIELTLERLGLTPLNPYTATGAGYRIDEGEASLRSTATVGGGAYEIDNALVLHDLNVDADDPAAFEAEFGISLDLALALLRDLAGDIRLSIPVAIDAEGRTDTGTAAIVAAALRQALFGALSSPFKLVGAALPALGGGKLSLDPLMSVPGEPGLVAGQDDKLGALAELLEARPQLGLVLRGRAGEADRPFVARRVLLERSEAGEDWPDVEGSGVFSRRRLRGAIGERERGEEGVLDPEDEALLARLIEALEIPPERLRAFALTRAERARDALVNDHGVDPHRIEVRDAPDEGDSGVIVGLNAAGAAG